MYCSQCGKENADTAQYCASCGVPLMAQPVAGHVGHKQDFWSLVFDFAFTDFTTTKIVKVIYGIWIVFVGGLVIQHLFSAYAFLSSSVFAGDVGSTIAFVIGAIAAQAVTFVAYVLGGRVVLELAIAVIRIAEALKADSTPEE